MRAREFLLEAKPESLGQGMLAKLFATYQSKPDVREFNFSQPIEVANEIFRHVGSNYLIWASKQYNQDRYFFLHDLPAWQETLTQFADLSKDRRIQIERDINRYQNIDQLRDVINNLTQKKTELGSKFYSKAISAINEFVEKGEADWLYQNNKYSIYHPKTFEASNLCAKLLSTTVCTILGPKNFKNYSEAGTLMYIITQDKLYNCFISKNSAKQNSEFADEQNDHRYNLEWMLNQFPALRSLIKANVDRGTEISVRLKVGLKITDKDIIEAVTIDPFQITEIENPSEEVQLAAAAKDGYAIRFIKNPSEAVQLAAVKENGNAISQIKNPNEAVQLAAVSNTGYAIRYIENPSEAVQLAAVNESGFYLIDILLEKVGGISEAVQLAIVNKSDEALSYFSFVGIKPTEKVQLFAVQKDGELLEYIDDPSKVVQLAAVKNSGDVIRYIDNPDEEVQLAAVSESGDSIKYIIHKGIIPSEAVKLAAVTEDGYAIQFIDNPSEEVQLAAVKNNYISIRLIDNPTDRVKDLYDSMQGSENK